MFGSMYMYYTCFLGCNVRDNASLQCQCDVTVTWWTTSGGSSSDRCLDSVSGHNCCRDHLLVLPVSNVATEIGIIDFHNFTQGQVRHLVCLQCKTVWSIPERFRGELLTIERYTNLCTFYLCMTQWKQIKSCKFLYLVRYQFPITLM